LECPEASEKIQAGDVIEADFDTGVITNVTRGETYQASAFPEFIENIIKAGGLVEYTRKELGL
jgi:3-isopropylmalate/(R)-2-methylmalate dehydratase small subunit